MAISEDKILEAKKYILDNLSVSDKIKTKRQNKEKLDALLRGEGFAEMIIKAQYLESDKRKEARRKFCRNINDMVARLMLPIESIYRAQGGVCTYKAKDEKLSKFLGYLSKIKHGKGVEEFYKVFVEKTLFTDPEGVVFMEFHITKNGGFPYPTIKSIDKIRNYEYEGVVVNHILFEPEKENISGKEYEVYRYVDGEVDLRFIHISDRELTFDSERSFEHGFGVCPARIKSNIYDVQTDSFLSPFDAVVPLLEEYGKTLSNKLLYKYIHFIPKLIEVVAACRACNGSGKDKSGGKCPECNGNGHKASSDMSEKTVIVYSGDIKDVPKIPEIASWILAPKEPIEVNNSELEMLEIKCFDTIWGTHVQKEGNKTATGEFIDVQPKENKLYTLSVAAEEIDIFITKMCLNKFFDNEEDRVFFKSWGKRFIIESANEAMDRLIKDKEKGLSTVILDTDLNEWVTAKYKNDPAHQEYIKKKLRLEPYKHYTIEQVNSIFGKTEAMKKEIFGIWWSELTEKESEGDYQKLKDMRDKYYSENIEIELNNPESNKDKAEEKNIN